jgi:hypothetical protein
MQALSDILVAVSTLPAGLFCVSDFFLKAISIPNTPQTVDDSNQNGPLLRWVIF